MASSESLPTRTRTWTCTAPSRAIVRGLAGASHAHLQLRSQRRSLPVPRPGRREKTLQSFQAGPRRVLGRPGPCSTTRTPGATLAPRPGPAKTAPRPPQNSAKRAQRFGRGRLPAPGPARGPGSDPDSLEQARVVEVARRHLRPPHLPRRARAASIGAPRLQRRVLSAGESPPWVVWNRAGAGARVVPCPARPGGARRGSVKACGRRVRGPRSWPDPTVHGPARPESGPKQ